MFMLNKISESESESECSFPLDCILDFPTVESSM